MAAVKETITVIDKSGKMVSTSKHLFGVFKEARNAYRERKAEIQASKHAEKQAQIAEREAHRAMANLAIDDRRSVASSRRSGHSKSSRPRYPSSRAHRDYPPSPGSRYGHQDFHDGYFPYQEPRSLQQVGRRHTDCELSAKQPAPVVAVSPSLENIDMDLAYGEVHPSALEHYQPNRPDEDELNGLVAKAKGMLEEADCLQHTASATMAHLEKNPDALAAIALTLAEISNIAAKMAPGILAGLKATAPSVFALLASPQFLIAAGVGVGVTIVMFGGYKIIKRLAETPAAPQLEAPLLATPQVERPALPREPSVNDEDLLELQSQHLSRVEVWRRGVADCEASSVGSTVDGEFITRKAAMMSGLDLTDPTVFRSRGLDADEGSTTSSRRSKHSRHTRHSHAHSQHSRRSGKSSSGRSVKEEPKKKSTTEPKRSSKLRLIFTA